MNTSFIFFISPSPLPLLSSNLPSNRMTKMKIKEETIPSRVRTQIIESFNNRQKKHPRFLQQIPSDIFTIIFTFLSVPDQVCFALSCKQIFESFHLFLKAQDKQLSQLLPRETRSILCPNAKKRPRNQLLLQLENKRWKYCSDCWILHPPPKLWSGAASAPYCPKCHLLGRFTCSQTCSTRLTDEIHLCPCLSITFRDKLHVLRTCIESRRHPGGVFYYNGVCQMPTFDTRLVDLLHKCTFEHPFYKVNVETCLYYLDYKGYKNYDKLDLHVRNDITFEVRRTPESLAEMKANRLCVHKHPLDWLRKFFSEAGSEFSSGPINGTCKCEWDNWEECRFGQDPMYFKIIWDRQLGGDTTWPVRPWYYGLHRY